MTGPSPRPLLIIVLDGHEPCDWRPWGLPNPKIDEALRPASKLVVPALIPHSSSRRPIAFRPLLLPVAELLASRRLGGIVGAIIDATTDPGDEAYYRSKIDELRSICVAIMDAATDEERLVQTVNAFYVWLIRKEYESEWWSKWDREMREAVTFALGTRVDVHSLPLLPPSEFERIMTEAASSYLKNVWLSFERGNVK